MQLTFTVNTKAPVATKGLAGVDANSLMVLAYDTDGNFISELPILKTSEENSTVKFLCNFNAALPVTSGADNAPSYKFVVLTNSTNQQYGMSYDSNGVPQIESLDFAYPFQSTVPMWGVKTYTLKYGTDGKVLETQELGQIDVLRSAAKVGVRLSDDLKAEGYTIKDIKINYVSGSGYSVPANWNTVDATDKLTAADGFRPASEVSLTDVSAFSISEQAGYEGMHYIYIPEIKNDKELAMAITFLKDGEEIPFTYENGIKFRTYLEGMPTDEKFNVVRNHFYDYRVTAINTSIELEMIEYETLPWIPEEVEVGGEVKYLVLNTDLVKIYSENVDATTLKFTSSSPIARVELKDVYSHDSRDGKFEKGSDAVSAYYVGKFGQKTQLGTDPGFTMPDKEAALDKERVILAHISAKAEQNVLQGGITITSPFVADPENEIAELRGDSHYDTVRYLEFEVTNEQGLTEIFRVEQYPPLTITNIEGYFSYREDFRVDNLPIQYFNNHFTANTLGSTIPVDNGEPCHWLNPTVPFFMIADYYPYHVHEWDMEKGVFKSNPSGPHPEGINAHGSCPTTYDGFEYMTHGLMEREYMRVDAYKDDWATGVFHRSHYMKDDGKPLIEGTAASKYYQSVGPIYEAEVEVDDIDPETGAVIGKKTVTKYYRRHYTGNSFNYFFSLVVSDYLDNGKVTLKAHAPSTNPVTKNEWAIYGSFKTVDNANHRMYHIRINSTSSKYSIGRPKMETVDGRTYTAEGEANSRMVSPSFMIASQLGTTDVPQNRDSYVVLRAGGMYPLAQNHCEQYAEAYFEDENGDGRYDEGEKVVHLNDWRLPTKAEIELIAEYQANSRAIDVLLTGKTYFCASTISGVSTDATVLSDEVPGATLNGYYIRCVRDVYED